MNSDYSKIERAVAEEYVTSRAELLAVADAYVVDAMTKLEDDSPLPGGGAWVWPFDKAPIELQALSESGGDEDWLVLWSPGSVGARGEYVRWHDRLGPSSTVPDEYLLPCGALVLIGAHS